MNIRPRTTCFAGLLLGAAFCCAEWLGLMALSAATLSDPQVDAYNCRRSAVLANGLYQFTTNASLLEQAVILTNLGINCCKFSLGNDPDPNYPNITNIMLLARDEPSRRTLFDMPTMKNYAFWCNTFANSASLSWRNGFTAKEAAAEYAEMYAFSQYLLTNYNRSGKSFYLGHWQGDWMLLSGAGVDTNPTPTAIQGTIDWLNARQKAVDDAVANIPHTNVNVYLYAEFNRLEDAYDHPTNSNRRMINYVIPYVTNLDYVSSADYGLQNQTNVAWWLNYAESFFPTNKAAKLHGKRLFIGEYGWQTLLPDDQVANMLAYNQTVFDWGCPFSFYWSFYNTSTNYLYLIDSAGNWTAGLWQQDYFWNEAKLQVLAFKQKNGRLPTDSEFNAIAASLLTTALAPPVSLALTTSPPTQVSASSAIFNATLRQGIYGDSLASVTAYWGPSDGGTNAGAWAHSLALGFNTNADTVSYLLLVSNLPPGDYYYRYHATSTGGNTWSEAAHGETLNPQNYGSQLRVTFNGYNRDATLLNFPVLVCLGTNLPGFSYAQFASPAGGDLRFCDESGGLFIPHEIDEWNTNGTSYVWVQMPALSGPTNSLWAYWGNAAATNPPAWTTNGAVWSQDYELVWHLKETNLPYADSTQQHPANTGTAPKSAPGAIGKGNSFAGSQYLSPATATFSNAFTLSAWVNVTNTASNIQTIWGSKAGSGGTNDGFALYVNSFQTSDQRLILHTADGTNRANAVTPTNAVSYGQWHLVSAVVEPALGKVTLYVDGVNQTISNSLQSGFGTQWPLSLGRYTASGSGYFFKGLIDEARIESTARDSNWIWASYVTVASNAAFASYGRVLRNQPSLTVAAGANGSGRLLLNWPGNDLTFSLYSATNVNAATIWYPVTNAPVLITNNHLFQNQITFPMTNDRRRFFRLKSP